MGSTWDGGALALDKLLDGFGTACLNADSSDPVDEVRTRLLHSRVCAKRFLFCIRPLWKTASDHSQRST